MALRFAHARAELANSTVLELAKDSPETATTAQIPRCVCEITVCFALIASAI